MAKQKSYVPTVRSDKIKHPNMQLENNITLFLSSSCVNSTWRKGVGGVGCRFRFLLFGMETSRSTFLNQDLYATFLWDAARSHVKIYSM